MSQLQNVLWEYGLQLFKCCVFSYAVIGCNYTSLNEGIRIGKDVEGSSQVLIWGTILGGTEKVHQKHVMAAGLWSNNWAWNFPNTNQNARQVDREFHSWTKQRGEIPMNLDRIEVFHVPTIRNISFFLLFAVALQPNWGLDRVIFDVSTHIADRHQLVAEAATCTTHNKHNSRTTMPSEGFEPAITAIKRLRPRPSTARPPSSAHQDYTKANITLPLIYLLCSSKSQV
jgi:hypothetical protein